MSKEMGNEKARKGTKEVDDNECEMALMDELNERFEIFFLFLCSAKKFLFFFLVVDLLIKWNFVRIYCNIIKIFGDL